mgnify:CR=1 FL=1
MNEFMDMIVDADPGDETEQIPGQLTLVGDEPDLEVDPFTELYFNVLAQQLQLQDLSAAVGEAMNILRECILDLIDGNTEAVKERLAIPEAEAGEVEDEA